MSKQELVGKLSAAVKEGNVEEAGALAKRSAEAT